MISFEFPRALGVDVNGRTSVPLDSGCTTVRAALDDLRTKAPAVLDRVVDESGTLRPHVNIFVNDESIRFLDGLDTRVSDEARILVLAAISGG
ncbi:MAG TPA: MoaD/ThiS family protein [Gemmatimonadaceae bacterium]|nr:MoaD/ThiS family protein [Gemmatimonadaceae bacterium]